MDEKAKYLWWQIWCLQYLTFLHILMPSYHYQFSYKLRHELANVRQHIIIHSREMLFSCAQCNFSCIKSNTLKTHMRTHSGEKPFRCDQCNYSCIQADQLKKHKLKKMEKSPFYVTSAIYLSIIPVVWSISCFCTPARNLLCASNATTPAQ